MGKAITKEVTKKVAKRAVKPEVKSIAKTTAIKTLITNVINQEVKADTTSTALFVGALAYFKGCISHKSTMQGLKEIVATVSDETKASKAFSQRANNVLQLASKTVEYGLHTIDNKVAISTTKLFFYNISKAINLLDHLRQTDNKAMVTVKNKLNKVTKVADKRAYNDNYAKELKALYKEYKVVLADDGAIVKIEMNEEGLLKMIEQLTPELRTFLLASLNTVTKAA